MDHVAHEHPDGHTDSNNNCDIHRDLRTLRLAHSNSQLHPNDNAHRDSNGHPNRLSDTNGDGHTVPAGDLHPHRNHYRPAGAYAFPYAERLTDSRRLCG